MAKYYEDTISEQYTEGDMGWLDDLDDSVSVSASMLLESKPYLNKPKQIGETYSSTLQDKNAILELLKGYQRVDNLDDVKLDTPIRYITLDASGKQVFRLGGKLIGIHPKYIKLEGGNKTVWCVKRKHYKDNIDNGEVVFQTVFFRKISYIEQLKKQLMYKIKINEVLRAILIKNGISSPTDYDIELTIKRLQEENDASDIDAETVLTETNI